MKRLLIIVSVVLMSFPLCAQKVIENDEIFATVGANVPMYKNIEGDVVVGLHYGHYYPNGVGFRAGFQYTPTVVDIDNSFGVPMAITFRTGSRSTSQKLMSAAHGVARTQISDGDNALKYGVASFLMNLFDRLEFHAGLTPGYVAGKSRELYPSYHSSMEYWKKTWTEKPSSFALSADAGFDVNFRIWRFDLKLMPAFHYNITDNYRYHIQEGVRDSDEITRYTVKPIKWFFTINGGLSFRF